MLTLALAAMVAVGADSLPLVQDGKPAAVIVLPADPFPVAIHAAEELVHQVEKASGAKLAIHHEPLNDELSTPAIYIGVTRAALDAGIQPETLTREAAMLRSIGRDLYVLGNDGPGDALSKSNTHGGTLWGVYEILERELGVRWLWPGDLGESVPVARDIRLPTMDRTFRPALNRRHLRPGLGPRGFVQAHESLGFSTEHRERYARDQTRFLRRHRMGMSEDSFYARKSFGSGHSFEGWWELYGKQHPEWFQLLPDGRRGPADPNRPHKVTMCVSNRDLQAEIVRRWREAREKQPDEPLNIGIGENDESALCTCDDCEAWDGPQPDVDSLPPGLERSYKPMQASNRYARFAEAVRARAAIIETDSWKQIEGLFDQP